MKIIILRKFSAIAILVMIPFALILPSDQIPAKDQDHPIALTGGTIHTVSGEVIHNGTILFESGRITKIGKNIDLPSGTEKIDVSGKHIYPGLINADTRLGLMEINSVPGSRDDFELGQLNPNIRAEVAVNPDSELLPVARARGIAIAHTFPRGGIISGKSAAIMLDGWTWEDMVLKAPVAMNMNWPNMTLFEPGPFNDTSKEDQKKARERSFKTINDFFADAGAYMKAKDATGRRGIPYHETDLRLEAMIPVLKGELPLWIAADKLVQIQSAIDWAESEGIKIVLRGADDSWRITDELKRMNIPVVVTNVFGRPARNWDSYDVAFSLAGKLHEAGVKFCFGYSTRHGQQSNVRFNAAMSVAHGLPADEAIKGLTLYAAEIMGIDDRVGSLEVGKDATLIVTDGNPLEIITAIEMEYIQGRKIDLDNKHKELYRKYTEKYRQKGLIK